MSISQAHLQSARKATQEYWNEKREKVKVKPWEVYKLPKVRLYQDDLGEWKVVVGEAGVPMMATDIEVALWLRIKELEGEK